MSFPPAVQQPLPPVAGIMISSPSFPHMSPEASAALYGGAGTLPASAAMALENRRSLRQNGNATWYNDLRALVTMKRRMIEFGEAMVRSQISSRLDMKRAEALYYKPHAFAIFASTMRTQFPHFVPETISALFPSGVWQHPDLTYLRALPDLESLTRGYSAIAKIVITSKPTMLHPGFLAQTYFSHMQMAMFVTGARMAFVVSYRPKTNQMTIISINECSERFSDEFLPYVEAVERAILRPDLHALDYEADHTFTPRHISEYVVLVKNLRCGAPLAPPPPDDLLHFIWTSHWRLTPANTEKSSSTDVTMPENTRKRCDAPGCGSERGAYVQILLGNDGTLVSFCSWTCANAFLEQ